MATIKYTDLLSEVLPHLTADPSEPAAVAALSNAVIEFCARSLVWRFYADAIDVTAGESTYQLEPPANADIATVLSCKYDGKNIDHKSTDDLDDLMPTWQTESSTVKWFTQVDTESVILAPLPDETISQGLLFVLALQPRRSSFSFPRWIASQYMEALAAGAIARLAGMNNKPWSDAETADRKRKEFDAAIASARGSGLKGLGRAVTRTSSYH